MKRRLLDVLFLALQNFANSKIQPKQSNSRCLRGMFISLLRLCRSKVHSSVIIHIGVGFCVARSDWIGQCEGLVGRDE